MTVAQVGKDAMTGEPTVWCTWFEKTKKFEDTFSPDALVLAPVGSPLSRAIPVVF
jgi:uncharacterized protein YodC (DUF2158 family)